jgi:hypothetical protein
MTVFNTGYSTIDEAWGESYLSPSLQQKRKKKNRDSPPKQSDPICDLYAMGNTHYADDDIISYANQYYEQHDTHNKVHYQKPMMRDRENRENRKSFQIRDESVYAYGAPYDYDMSGNPGQVDRGVQGTQGSQSNQSSQSNQERESRRMPYQQDDQNDQSDQPMEERKRNMPVYTYEMDEPTPELSMREPQYAPVVQSRRNKRYDSQEYYMGSEDPDYYRRNSGFNMMDISLYIISGIILIFMMEQFVKIGLLLQA